MGKIVFENFNEGDGYYNINLAYLSKEQFEEIETLVSKWNHTDEDIKDCIRMCLTDANEQRFEAYGTTFEACLTWLEKQGEQKLADKVEPKFKIGDWVICEVTGLIYQIGQCIENLSNHKYGYDLIGGGYIGSDEAEFYHLWAIQDAKDGDVLAFSNDTIVMFKDLYNSSSFHSYCHMEDGEFGISEDDMPDWWKANGFLPATKEQRNTLFQKIKEAGYEWDTEEKELRRNVEPKFKIGDWITNGRYNKFIVGINSDWPFYIFKDGTSERIKDVDKKYHLWTVQDAKDGDVLTVNGKPFICYHTDEYKGNYCCIDDKGCFRTNLRFSFEGNCILPATKEQSDTLFAAMKAEGYEWDAEKKELRKIEQVSAWSEEDDYNLQCMIAKAVNDIQNGNVGRNQELIDWLKTLKGRVQPQNMWKPSKEQIDALEHFVRSIGESDYASPYDNNTKLLYSLLEQLKKL